MHWSTSMEEENKIDVYIPSTLVVPKQKLWCFELCSSPSWKRLERLRDWYNWNSASGALSSPHQEASSSLSTIENRSNKIPTTENNALFMVDHKNNEGFTIDIKRPSDNPSKKVGNIAWHDMARSQEPITIGANQGLTITSQIATFDTHKKLIRIARSNQLLDLGLMHLL